MNGEGRGRRLDWGQSEGGGRGEGVGGEGRGIGSLLLARVLKERWGRGGAGGGLIVLTLTRVSYVF